MSQMRTAFLKFVNLFHWVRLIPYHQNTKILLLFYYHYYFFAASCFELGNISKQNIHNHLCYFEIKGCQTALDSIKIQHQNETSQLRGHWFVPHLFALIEPKTGLQLELLPGNDHLREAILKALWSPCCLKSKLRCPPLKGITPKVSQR